MSNTIFLTFIFCVMLAIMLFSGLVKTVKFSFDKDPGENAYQSQDIRQTQSERTADLKDENEDLMDKVRTQQEKNDDMMERNRAMMERNRAMMERNRR